MPTKIIGACVGVACGIYGFWAIVCGHVLLNIPFATYQFYLAFGTLDEQVELVARSLGAKPLNYYLTVVIKLLERTIVKTATFIFLLCFTAISLPLMLGCSVYHSTPDVILYKNVCSMHEKFFYAVFRIVVVLFLLFLQCKNSIEFIQPPVAKKLRPAKKNGWLFCYSFLIFTFLCTPLFLFAQQIMSNDVLIFLKSVWHGFVEPLLNNVQLLEVVHNSLVLAGVSACGAAGVGVMLDVLLCRTSQRPFFLFFIYLPIILGGPFTIWLLGSTNFPPKMIAIFCHIFTNYPFAYFIIQTQMALCSKELYFLAQSLGASRLIFFKTVQFPLMRNALITAWYVAFGLSMAESVGASEHFVTIARAIHVYRAAGKTTEVVGMSVLLLVLVGMVVGCVRGVAKVFEKLKFVHVLRVSSRVAAKVIKVFVPT